MSLKINSFGGPLIWLLRKHCSRLTSKIMLKYAYSAYHEASSMYIDRFLSLDDIPLPLNVMIETVNRCNGKCEFCPANSKDEKRPFKKMTEEVFYEIVRQLKTLEWHGKLFMCVNNEPFIDNRILQFSRYAKELIPELKIVIISNGTLLNTDTMDSMVGIVDQITINDYSEQYAFTDKNKELIKHIKRQAERFKSMQIVFNRRYCKEILATRAGSAPNKPKKNVEFNIPCLYPFTDMIIFPDGKVGMCCNDCFEVTDYGNIMEKSIDELWGGVQFQKLRNAMRGGRFFPFCKECDVVDAGEREKEIMEELKIKRSTRR